MPNRGKFIDMEYAPTIGLEIHVELKTKTKMFCDSANDPDEKHPNINICPICMGHPGTLPTINEQAIKNILKVGAALNCQISEFSKFDRKNYFYPDLPKGYQISQYDLPLCKNGWLVINNRKVRITRIHMEEDTGRLLHPDRANYTLVDFNRAGIPLMELVTEPDLKTGDDVRKFASELNLILRYLDVSDANMEKGQMRVEVNLSVAPAGADVLGTKVEVKNINSINAAGRAVDYEIKRQSELLDGGEKVKQETRGWDEDKGKTFSQRVKEGSADYRYFPEPDLPPLRFPPTITDNIEAVLPELPQARRERFKKDYGLNDPQVEVFTAAKRLGDYYEKVATELDAAARVEHISKGLKGNDPEEKHLPVRLHALAANYIITEFPPLLGMRGVEIDEIEGIKIEPEAFAELMVMIFHEELSSTNAKLVLKEMAETGLHPAEIIEKRDLSQVSDIGFLQIAAQDIVLKNVKAVEDYRSGKTEVLKFLVGQMMRETKGKANPELAQKILEKLLG